MIVRLTGKLIDSNDESVVVEQDGIAREVLVPRYVLAELVTHNGKLITLHTLEFLEGKASGGNLIPRILGFLHPLERLFFQRFDSVKGMGPRKVLKAFVEPPGRIAGWIESGDAKALARLPGIGARAADLLIASLKGKLKEFAAGNHRAAGSVTLSQAQRDALEVLIAWGDPRGEVERWLDRAAMLHPEMESADEWVRAAYRVKAGVEG